MPIARTHSYDPRFDRAQTIDGAKARYVSEDCPEYDIEMLEADIDRLLTVESYPDATPKQDATRECFTRRV